MTKTINYCWFGGKPLPKSALRCIASWRKFLPDYEIVEWNEQNFDVNEIPYTRQAYAVGKYAYVSDYARYKILYEQGGLYFDTDVEMIAPLTDIIARSPFMGMEEQHGVNPGLGMGAEPGHPIYKEVLDHYRAVDAVAPDGTVLPGIVVPYTTEVLLRRGLDLKATEPQCIDGIWIYPNEYFNPLDDFDGRLRITPNTRSIHYYSKTWANHYGPLRTALTRLYHRLRRVF